MDGSVRAAFQEFDQNGDQKIDFVEYEMSKVRVLSLRDADADGALSAEEALVNETEFSNADQDKDGSLSGLEWITAPFTSFATVDGNSDQFVTPEEFDAFATAFGK